VLLDEAAKIAHVKYPSTLTLEMHGVFLGAARHTSTRDAGFLSITAPRIGQDRR
jgi:hypothetical protein